MFNDKLKIIDFSKGIKDTEVQHNFNALLSQLKRERLSVAGYGVSKGLNLTIEGFKVTVSEGTVVDINGEEIHLDSKTVTIDYPELIQEHLSLQVADEGIIALINTPYATTKTTTSENDILHSGVKILDFNNVNREIPVINIYENIITVDSRWSQQMVDISYYHTNKRYDTIYIDSNYTIQKALGTTSPSPSVYIPKDYKFILGFVEVNPFYKDLNLNTINAICTLKEETDKFRNIYTDENNNLYICGTPFENMQIVHMEEPVSPVENTLYYDTAANKLKVWKTYDNIASWVPVNDTSVVPVLEIKMWQPNDEDYPDDKQTFIFNSKKDLNMRFIPSKHELALYIDQNIVFFDQFTELTLKHAKDDLKLRNLLKTKYGYIDDEIDNADDLYENTGIGFKLGKPLDKQRYIEARTTHRVNEGPLRVRFQRSATFVKSKAIIYDGNNTISTEVPYRVGECQLEVYCSGRRLDNTIGFTEGTDLLNPKNGDSSKEFVLTAANIAIGDTISYKITSSIYSYDDINKMFDNIKSDVEVLNQDVKNIKLHEETINSIIVDAEKSIVALSGTVSKHEETLSNIEAVVQNNIPSSITSWVPKGIINKSFIKTGSLNKITEIKPGDFIVVFDISISTGNNVLVRDIDYTIEEDTVSGSVYFNFISAVPDGHNIYIIGLNF